MKYSFKEEIFTYISHIESLNDSYKLLNPIILLVRKSAATRFNNFLDEKGVKTEETDLEKSVFSIPNEHFREYTRLKKRVDNTRASNIFIPRSFIVSMVSLYDAYLGKLIKAMFLAVPEKLNASQKQIEFGQILKFTSLDEAKEFLIEKEVETVLRTSHIEQFEWLEKKLSITLRKGLLSWANFVEITERRNLFVHTDGLVSSQYINVCTKNKVDLNNINIGDTLNVSPKYFTEAFNCLFEIGVKLGQVMWRKLCPEEISQADTNLVEVCFNLISEGNYNLAINLLEFADESLLRNSSSEVKYMFTINLAQAYKWDGKTDKMKQILKNTDWNVLAYHFRLSYEVLMDNYDAALNIMKKIGEDEISREDYHDWPLFKEFRKTALFQEGYKEKFGVDFVMSETQIEKEESELTVKENNAEESGKTNEREPVV